MVSADGVINPRYQNVANISCMKQLPNKCMQWTAIALHERKYSVHCMFIFLTMIIIYGRWLGIRISGLDQRMNMSLTRQFKLD